jgi:tetratricopeptide (TPR) repeat protein
LNMDKGLFNKAKDLFEEAARISKETSALFTQSAALTNLAEIEYYLGDHKSATNYALQALEISKEIEDIEGEGINNVILAKISIELGLQDDAKHYLDIAYEHYEQLDNEDGWSDYYYYLAQYYKEYKQYDLALENAYKSKELSARFKSSRKLSKALRLIAILLQEANDYTASIALLNQSIELLEEEEAAYELLKSHYFRAIAYSKLGNEEAANKDYEAAAANAKKIDKCKWTKIIEHGIN